jgi:hypothetical protein
MGRRRTSALHGVWLSVFGVEAILKGDDLAHQLGALALGGLFTALVVTEVRSRRTPPYGDPGQGSASSATWSPIDVAVPGGTTANASAMAAPRSIAAPR